MDKQLIGLLLGASAALCGLIVLMIRSGFNKIWGEIRELRKVRHENLDRLTQNDAKLTLLEFSLGDLKTEGDLLKKEMQLLKKAMQRRYIRMKEIIKKNAHGPDDK